MLGPIITIWRVGRDVFALADEVRLGLIAAGVAFFSMFSIFPGMAAMIAIFGLVADPVIVDEQLELLRDIVPVEAFSLIDGQLDRLLSARSETLGLATLFSLLLAIWSARAGVAALIQGLNAICGRPNRKGLWHYLVAVTLTVTLIAISLSAVIMVVIVPLVLAFVPLPEGWGWIVEMLRWCVTFLIVAGALSVLYRYGPNRRGDRMAWVTPGSFAVVIVWVGASVGFSYYLTNFGSYNEVYGSIGAVIAMLMWLYISASLVLFGMALNVVLERRRKYQVGSPEAG